GGGFREDANRGVVLRGDTTSSLRRELPLGFDAELGHAIAGRLNKIGYDPYGYRGLELHQARGRLGVRLGPVGTAAVGGGYDLRNRQDTPRRRWLPLTAQAAAAPRRGVSLSADGEFDLWYARWRRVAGSAGYSAGTNGFAATLRPSVTDNRLGLPLATTTSPEYRVAQHLYGSSFQNASIYPRIVLLNADVTVPLTSRLRVSLLSQFDLQPPPDLYLYPAARGRVQRHIRYYTVTVTRDLHCWELTGAFERYATGELRFNASLNLKAFPTERVPLLSL
ncbi:MAG: hypothetical protein AAB368_16110, partial [bacterium]